MSSFAFVPPSKAKHDLEKLQQMTSRDGATFSYAEGEGGHKVATLHFDRSADMTLLYSHGNAEDLLDIREDLSELADQLNINVLAYDYSGYGLSAGSCSEEACYKDIFAAFRHLQRLGVSRNSIVLMGRSLGTGPTLELAKLEPGIAGVILQSPFVSALHAKLSDPVAKGLNNINMFSNGEKIRSVTSPVFIVHGTDDKIVPVVNGRELFRLAPNAVQPWWITSCGHNDIPKDKQYYQKLGEFIHHVHVRQARLWEKTADEFKDLSPTIILVKPSSKKLILTAL